MADQPIPDGASARGGLHGPPATEPPAPASAPGSTPDSSHVPIGAALEPVLRDACAGRLSEVHWFRTDWQRGGAATGYARFTDDAGRARDVVVKLPVPPGERAWLERLKQADHLVPYTFASGDALNGYDLAWVVMERLPHGPLGTSWNGHEFDLLLEAAARFHAAGADLPLTDPPPRDWQQLHEQARRNLREHDFVENEQRWKNALKAVGKKLAGWLKIWNGRPINAWCHGDLHLANAMTRRPAPDGPAVLLDLAKVHPGHWVEDAIYCEHLFWARRHRLGDRRLCSQLSRERKKLGLPVDADWPRLASIKRILLAMSTPAMLTLDGDRTHLHAALEVLEREIGG